MKSPSGFRLGIAALAFGVTALLEVSSLAAQSNTVRLAVGPFFAPAADGTLQEAGAALPDLLTAELSHQNRFQLVERDKVSAIWSELHLTSSGLAASDTVAKLGRMLACDWLVSGSLVPTGTRTQVWIKVIDMRNSVVLDLEALPFESTNLSATVTGVAAFVVNVRGHPQGRQFISLGRFTDLSISSTREDWSRRLPALIEKHFHAAGLGVVERQAISPIFEEFELETAGLTGSAANRVKLQPAFWIVDGGCKWVRDTQDKLSVALRVQKMGEKEQVFRFTTLPGDELEAAVIRTIQKAMANTNQIPAALAATKEAEIHDARGTELAERRAPMSPSRFSTNQPAQTTGGWSGPDRKKLDENRRTTIEAYERAVLLDPKNLNAKYMLGYGLLGDRDPAKRQRGKDLLREVVASNDPKYVEQARRHLENADLFLRMMEPAPVLDGTNAVIVALGAGNQIGRRVNPATPGHPLVAKQGDEGRALAAVANRTNVAFKAAAPIVMASASKTDAAGERSLLQLPMPIPSGRFPAFTAAATGEGEVLVAGGTKLYRFNGEINDVQPVDLPITLNHPITAIASSEHSIWLGTEGGGLVQIDRGGKPPRIYTEKDGLLMPSILSLARIGERLWIGFGFRESGGLGYLELPAERFVGLTGDVGLFKSDGDRLHDPPDSAVEFIKTADEQVLWIGTRYALHRFEIGSSKWSRMSPLGQGGVTLGSTNYVAIVTPSKFGSVMVCKLPGDHWDEIDLSPAFGKDNYVCSLRARDNSLWVGGDGKLGLIDARTLRVVAVRE
jgi:TolB-like protein